MRKLSYLLIIILLSSFLNLLPVRSQPNGCININGIKTPELVAQFETWLNEPNGLNARFLDKTETSQERGERLFYDLVLNNNQICLSDLTQEMIDSITWVINSYDNAIDHNYLVNGLIISRSQINLGFKAIRDSVILRNPSIFAEAIQFSRPDFDFGDSNVWLDSGGSDCQTGGIDCFTELNETIRDDSDFIRSVDNPISEGWTGNLSTIIDPGVDTDHFFNWTYSKDVAAGKQIDVSSALHDEFSATTCLLISGIVSRIFTDIPDTWSQDNFTLTTVQASNIDDYGNLCFNFIATSVGGGAARHARFSWYQLGVPDVAIGPFDIQTALPIETISQMLFQVHGGTLGGLHHFVLQEIFQEHNSFSNWIEVFRDEDIIRFRLCALPTPVSRNATNHIIRFTALSRGTGVVERLSIHILNSTQDIIQEFPETDISRNEFETHNFTLTQANTDAIDDYSLIFIELHATNLGVNDDESIFITQAQLDIPETDLTVVCIPEEEVLGTSELFPLAPLMNLFFIIGGFLLVFNAKGRLEFQASGMFFFLASLLFIISPIYAVLDSNNVLSYVILNYPDSIRNNFVLINFVFIGLGLTSVIINNKSRLGFR